MDRPLEFSCSLKLLDFDSEDNDYEARQVFWHSSAHVLGEACERRYEGCCLGYGPPLPEGGFFYDMSLAEGKTLGPDDYKHVEDVAKIAVKEKQPFERLELPKEVLLEMFKVCPRIVSSRLVLIVSTTSISSIISKIRSLMEHRLPSIDVVPSLISVSVLMFPTLAESRR